MSQNVILYLCVFCILTLTGKVSANEDYEVPPAIIKPLQPRGLQVSIPDYDGVTLFAFHGKVNEDFEHGREAGEMSVDVLRKRNGHWTYTNRHIKLKKGDIIYYWLYVIKNGLGYERLFQSYEVKEFYEENQTLPTTITPPTSTVSSPPITSEPEYQTIPTTITAPTSPISSTPINSKTENSTTITPPTSTVSSPPITNKPEYIDDKIYFPTNSPPRKTSGIDIRDGGDWKCEKSITTVNGKEACRGYLVFSSDFSNGIGSNWSHEVHFNSDESEFVVFDNNPANSFSESNRLIIKPTLLDDHYGEGFTLRGPLDLTSKCTSREHLCEKERNSFSILPPIMSARLTTEVSFSFKYGVIEIKAKLPSGDWVIPEIWLKPKHFPYGVPNAGKVILAKSIGNTQLTSKEESIGSILLTSGLQVNEKTKTFKNLKDTGVWSDEFHVFKLEWTERKMTFYVDDQVLGDWDGTNPVLLEGHGPFSPFDQEFYIVLGIHVGGYEDIADGALSKGRPKPWKNFEVRRMKKFYEDIKAGNVPWTDDTMLQVDYIKVWAM